MTSHVVVACEDAGAAAALAPVAAALLARGDHVSWRLGPVALQTMRARGLDPQGSEAESSSVIAEADGLLAGTTAWGARLEARAVLEAREHRCPSLALIDFWSSYEPRLSYPSATGLDALPDRLALIDGIMHADLVAAGVAPSRLVITGSPAFDATLASRGTWSPSGRRVLFLSQPIKQLFGGALGYTEQDVLLPLAAVVAEAGAELIVRPHPREDAAALGRVVAALPCATRMDTEQNLLASVHDARAVVGMMTMALVHAALLGAPTFSVQVGRSGVDPLATNRGGLTTPVADVAELRTRVLEALTENAPMRAPSLPEGWSADATGRVISALDALMEKKP